MNRKEFEIWTRNHIRLMDGATGSNLMKAGMPRGVCTESWVLDHPEALTALQQGYKTAGSDMVYAPTFCANRIALASSSLEGEVCRMNRELVALSKQAVGSGILVAGDMTTTGKPADPEDSAAYQLLFDAYREQAEALMPPERSSAKLRLPCTMPTILLLFFSSLSHFLYKRYICFYYIVRNNVCQ